MAEHIKFTFKSTNKERAILWPKIDDKFIMLVEAPEWPECMATGAHRPVTDIWIKVPDDFEDGPHTLQIDMIPMNEFIESKLESIEVNGKEFKFIDKRWGDVVTTYQQESAVDDANINHYRSTSIWPHNGELVTIDLNRDNQLDSNKYWKFKWFEEPNIYGKGSWTFTFALPYTEWWDNIFK
jgi:hypothetical protein